MIRTFRYPLLPNRRQENVLDAWRIACQQLYNAALQERRDAWQKQRVYRSRYDQYKALTALRASDAKWQWIPTAISRSALARLDRAFAGFFRRIKAGEEPGYPRFRAQDRYDSFDIGRVSINDDHINVPKLGPVRFKLYRPIKGMVRNISLVKTARRWMLCISCDLGAPPAKLPVRSTIGIDVGLEAFATLSNGARIENPRFFRDTEDILARHQRALARKRKESMSRKRQKQIIARTYERNRNRRLDFARKLTCSLFVQFDLVAYEDLLISRMVHGNLAKSIYDAAWGRFLRCLALKAENAGKYVIAVDPRGTSQQCSGCGRSVQKDLSQREHRCDGCGLVLHRDENAARNVLARGLRAVQLTEAS